ncbi:metal-dependent hydrolase [Paenibacillus kobensis]|uniref:metal-dependent hydrolase n=1 Tax=Paenibacillus kobensis TaxID=59841 RepID=UPI000FD9FFDC|nr:metal-dependent hydrolase [Paenibacillus kobensis]
MKVTFLGHSCFLVEAGGKRFVIDPFLSGNPSAAVRPEQLESIDAVLVTHGHGDHTGDAVAIAKANDCPIITTFELGNYFARQGASVHPMGIGGAFNFPWGRVKVTPAWHSGGIEYGDGQFEVGGIPAGFLLTVGGQTLYHAGDTGLFSDMKLIAEWASIDVACLPIGDNFTMGIEDSVRAASWLQSKLTIPMHYNTFPPIKQDPAVWAEQMNKAGLKGQVLSAGESVEV